MDLPSTNFNRPHTSPSESVSDPSVGSYWGHSVSRFKLKEVPKIMITGFPRRRDGKFSLNYSLYLFVFQCPPFLVPIWSTKFTPNTRFDVSSTVLFPQPRTPTTFVGLRCKETRPFGAQSGLIGVVTVGVHLFFHRICYTFPLDDPGSQGFLEGWPRTSGGGLCLGKS